MFADDLRKTMESPQKPWRLDKKNVRSPLLDESTKQVLISGYWDLMIAAVDAHKMIQKDEITLEEAIDVQSAKVDELLKRLMANHALKTMPADDNARRNAALRLIGSVVSHARDTGVKMDIDVYVRPEFFGHSPQSVRDL